MTVSGVGELAMLEMTREPVTTTVSTADESPDCARAGIESAATLAVQSSQTPRLSRICILFPPDFYMDALLRVPWLFEAMLTLPPHRSPIFATATKAQQISGRKPIVRQKVFA
jgi:hypothetical protein